MNKPAGLLEVSPGRGWLAREGRRLVWVHRALDEDAAHATIEPLLTEPTFVGAATRARHTRGNPQLVVAELAQQMRIMCLGFDLSYQNQVASVWPTEGAVTPSASIELPITAKEMSQASCLDAASGMLVEGVIRAGGWRWHQPATTVDLQEAGWTLSGEGRTVQLSDALVIGRPIQPLSARNAANFLAIDDPLVSRRHAAVRIDSGGPHVIDFNSRNGTWVIPRDQSGPVAVHDRVPYHLTDGDTLLFGKSWFVCVRSGLI